jgi:hypothetical protein
MNSFCREQVQPEAGENGCARLGILVYCVNERTGGKDDALLERRGHLRLVGIDRPDKIEAVEILLCQIAHPPFENAKLPDVQPAQLGHKVDIRPSAYRVGHQMPAMEFRPGRIRMPCHAAGVTLVFGEDRHAIGHNRSLQIDIEEIGDRRARVVQIDLNQLRSVVLGIVVIAPERNQSTRNIRDDKVPPIRGYELPVCTFCQNRPDTPAAGQNCSARKLAGLFRQA